MKKILSALSLMLASATLVLAPMEYVEAKRLGGGRPAGMQRQMPPKQPAQQPQQGQQPNNATAPVNGAAAGGAAAAAGKRSWMGPIAGLAAGLGIAALMSHLGMGEAFGNFLTMALLALAAVFVIRWLMRRFGSAAPRQGQGMAYAGAGAGPGATSSPFGAPQQASPQQTLRRQFESAPAAGLSAAATGGASSAAAGLPGGMSAADFERVAKMLFIRLQAANDAGQVDDLRKFTTPELFASLRLDLQDRGNSGQQTDVMQLDAELVDTAQEDGHWVASVRFHGLIREQADQPAESFDELWHFVKPVAGERDWAIAGISPVQA